MRKTAVPLEDHEMRQDLREREIKWDNWFECCFVSGFYSVAGLGATSAQSYKNRAGCPMGEEPHYFRHVENFNRRYTGTYTRCIVESWRLDLSARYEYSEARAVISFSSFGTSAWAEAAIAASYSNINLEQLRCSMSSAFRRLFDWQNILNGEPFDLRWLISSRSTSLSLTEIASLRRKWLRMQDARTGCVRVRYHLGAHWGTWGKNIRNISRGLPSLQDQSSRSRQAYFVEPLKYASPAAFTCREIHGAPCKM